MQIKMGTKRAINILNVNKLNHIDEYSKQLQGWKEDMEKYNENMKTWANNGGNNKERPKEPYKPESYEKDYIRLINIIENHDDEYIYLGDKEIENIIENKFGWSGTFLSNSTTYIKA